jgi:tryptophan synthase alpha chain
VVVGFGIRSAAAAAAIAPLADGVAVGSAIVERIGRGDSLAEILHFVAQLADATHNSETAP